MGEERPGESADRESGDGDRPPNTVSVAVLDPRRRLAEPALGWLRRSAAAACQVQASAGRLTGEVRVRLVGDEEMSAAHERHKGQAGTTDVLTFDLSEQPGVLDVDILACVDEAARQAAQRGLAAERELLLYVVHGVLHCSGYDDHTEEQARAMHAREDELLEGIGVGATFAAGDELAAAGRERGT